MSRAADHNRDIQFMHAISEWTWLKGCAGGRD